MNKLIAIPILAIILIGIDFYVFQAVKVSTADWSIANKKNANSIYWGLTALLISCLFVYHFVDPVKIGRTARTIIMVGIFMIYFSKFVAMIVLFLGDIISFFTWIMAYFSTEPSPVGGVTRSAFLAKLSLAMGAIPFFGMSYGILFGAHDYRVKRKKVYLPNLPKSFDGLKIAQISDIHSGSFYNKTAVKRGVEMLMKEAADVVFFTGDLVNNQATEVEDYLDVFGEITAPMGVFSVLGNHDYGDYISWDSEEEKRQNLVDLKAAHGKMGWRLLLNENEVLEKEGEQIAIIGVENWGTKGFVQHGDLKKAHEGVENTPVKLLLSHDPSHWNEQVKDTNIDITFSGHTHGMQFGVEIAGLKWSPIKYRYPQWAGLYQDGEQYLYVNRGFGYLGYPGRIGMSPEITVLELHRGNS